MDLQIKKKRKNGFHIIAQLKLISGSSVLVMPLRLYIAFENTGKK